MEENKTTQTDAQQGAAEQSNDKGTEKKEFNQSEIDALVGKAVDTALKNNDKKWQAKLEEETAKAKTEAEEYAKMTAAEKQKAQAEKERAAFEKEKAEFEKEKLLVAIKSDLQENNLPIAFAGALVNIGDAEKIKEALKSLKETWDAEIAEAIKSKARQDVPGTGGKFNTEEKSSAGMAEMARKARIIK